MDFSTESYRVYLRIRKEKIGWFKFILEGYDGMATLSTLSVKEGLVAIWIPQSSLVSFFKLLESIAEELTPFSNSTP